MNHDDKIKEVMGAVDVLTTAVHLTTVTALNDGDTEEFQALSAAKVRARALVESKLREMMQIPPGYALVPVEATEEMHVAAVKTIQRCTGNDDFPPRVWRAMLSAAPTPNTSADALKNLEI